MAKKNEVLLSIALEGDAEVKAKLAAVGEASKKSLQDVEKRIGDAGSTLGQVGEGGGLQKALAPILETSGIQGALSGVTGLLSRFGGVIAGGGLPTALAAIGAHLAKINEETAATEQRLKSLGASAGAVGKLRQSARAVDADPKELTGQFEEFLPQKRRQELQSPFGVADVSENQFLAAQRALIAGAKIDNVPTTDAVAKAGSFLSRLYQPHDVGDGTQAQGLAAGGLSGLSPSQANRVARALGGELNIPFRNADELSLFLEQKDSQGRAPVIRPDAVFRALQRDEPGARTEAERHRTVGDANERLRGRLSGIQESVSDVLGPPSGKAATGVTDTISEGLDQIRQRIDANKPLAQAYGESGRNLGERTGIPGAARAGELVGTTEGLSVGILRDAAKGYGILGGQIGDALGLRPPAQPQVAPDAPYGFLKPLQQRELEQQRIRDQMQSVPQQPVTPQRTGAAQSDQSFQTAGLAQTIVDAIRSALDSPNRVIKQDNRNLGPDETLPMGIRGEAPSGTAVADAGASITTAGDKLAAALDGVTALITRVQATEPTAKAATGGLIRKNLDTGGHVSGPGTSTSDSIPAMLSDGEYVIKTSSARKLGRTRLDRLNAGLGFADGGDVTARRLAMVRRFADGGDASDDDGVVSRTLANPTTLGPGQHDIAFDPATGGAYVDGVLHLPGDPLLDDPVVRRGMAQSRAATNQSQQPSKSGPKSDFVGRFGHSDDSDTYVAAGGPIGSSWAHFANGGLATLAPMLHLVDGGSAGVSGAAAPTIDGAALAAPSGSLGHYDVDLRTNHGDFKMMAPEDVARQMSRAARDASTVQTGQLPDWYR